MPYATYVDQASCLGGGKRSHFNQFKKSCEGLNIRIIFASSLEDKGRIERTRDTVQERTTAAMSIRKVHHRPAANDYLQTQLILNYLKVKNVVVAKDLEIRYKPLVEHIILKEIFCLLKGTSRRKNGSHSSRENLIYQLESHLNYSIPGQKIEFRAYQDLTWRASFANQPISLKLFEKPTRLKLAA